MRTTRPLEINEVINNNELIEIFKCQAQGGMRKSNRFNTLTLITDKTALYKDKLVGDIFHYTGHGQIGDQQLKVQNKNLADSKKTDLEVHFFEVLESKKYTYKGIVELYGEPYKEIQKDKNGKNREVYVFPIKLKNKNASFFGEGIKEEIEKIETLTKEMEKSRFITKTEIERTVKVRIGQGTFRKSLLMKESKCAICDVSNINVLIASHIVPWSISTNKARVDHNNGLLLCSNHDSLFDKHLISFDGNGKIVLSNTLSELDLKSLNLSKEIKIKLNKYQKKYMKKHNEKFSKES